MTVTTNDLHVHFAVMRAPGPQALTALAFDPTPAELADFEARMASLAGLTDEKVCARIGIPTDLLPKFRQLMTKESPR